MGCVEFSNLQKSFGQQIIIAGISLEIPTGIITAIVGESGSGKTTLLQLVNGLLRPDKGVVKIFGTPLDYGNLAGVRRGMGYAVQGAGIFPHMTVFENVTIVARLSGWSESAVQERYQHLMALLELTDEFSSRYPHSLSGGQQQRVSLGRAMMLNPPLLLLDEPFSALDPITRTTIREQFLHLQQVEPRSVLFVTHDMTEARKLAQHAVVLQQGNLLQEGSIAAVAGNPVSEYVENLFRGSGT
jgi:osmoprotectant transport system ATP-binding protein